MAKVVRERLGVEVRDITPREVQKYTMDSKQGVVITKVDPKGPLGGAGFEVGDVILGVENQPIDGVGTFIAIASALKPKQTVTLIALDHRSGNRRYHPDNGKMRGKSIMKTRKLRVCLAIVASILLLSAARMDRRRTGCPARDAGERTSDRDREKHAGSRCNHGDELPGWLQ